MRVASDIVILFWRKEIKMASCRSLKSCVGFFLWLYFFFFSPGEVLAGDGGGERWACFQRGHYASCKGWGVEEGADGRKWHFRICNESCTSPNSTDISSLLPSLPPSALGLSAGSRICIFIKKAIADGVNLFLKKGSDFLLEASQMKAAWASTHRVFRPLKHLHTHSAT